LIWAAIECHGGTETLAFEQIAGKNLVDTQAVLEQS
jgi:hypothetical protein